MTSAAHTPLTQRLHTLVIGVSTDADRVVLSPRGELVLGCADTLADALGELPAGTGRIDVLMDGVTFMDTAGLQFLDLLDSYGRGHGVPVTTAGWTGQPRRVLELAGLDTADPLRHPAPGAPGPGAPASSAVALERAEQLGELREQVEQLRRAIVSRPLVDQARGVLMATHACTVDEAWDILREASQRSNTKLRTVAAAVTSGAGTGGPPPPPELRRALRAAVAHCLGGAAAPQEPARGQ
jgi:anti-anti-sigma regulatory factor